MTLTKGNVENCHNLMVIAHNAPHRSFEVKQSVARKKTKINAKNMKINYKNTTKRQTKWRMTRSQTIFNINTSHKK